MKKILLLLFITFNLLALQGLRIDSARAREIGKKIWQNECNGTVDGLTSWNDGEQFASLGIGHFIWYPPGKKGTFKESFPTLLRYLQNHGKKIPRWLENAKGAPWSNKATFDKAKNSKKMQELRSMLFDTIELQTQFMVDRLVKILADIETKLPTAKAAHIKKQFYRVAHSPNGFYALIDYVNFKGEGFTTDDFNIKETYNNQGWGLIQVLETMQGNKTGKTALDEFAQSAKKILVQRVKNSPVERNEARWLKGWFKRIDTYFL